MFGKQSSGKHLARMKARQDSGKGDFVTRNKKNKTAKLGSSIYVSVNVSVVNSCIIIVAASRNNHRETELFRFFKSFVVFVGQLQVVGI